MYTRASAHDGDECERRGEQQGYQLSFPNTTAMDEFVFHTGLSASSPLLKVCKSMSFLPSPELAGAGGVLSGQAGAGLRRNRNCRYVGRLMMNGLICEIILGTPCKRGNLSMITIDVDLTAAADRLADRAGCLNMLREANMTWMSRSSKRLKMQMRSKAPSTEQKPYQLMLV